jgi:hypothetical protein
MLRAAVFVLVGLDAVLLVLLLYSALFVDSDSAGEGMAQTFATMGATLFALTAGPAFALAINRRHLPIAAVPAAMPLAVATWLYLREPGTRTPQVCCLLHLHDKAARPFFVAVVPTVRSTILAGKVGIRCEERRDVLPTVPVIGILG